MGYFFGPVRQEQSSSLELELYTADDAILVARFSDDLLVSGRWKILKSSSNWDRDDWPLPEFRMIGSHSLTGRSYVVTYQEDRPDRFASQREIEVESEGEYPPDIVFAPENLEQQVAEIFGLDIPPTNRQANVATEGVTYALVIPHENVVKAVQRLADLGFRNVVVREEEEEMADVLISQRGQISSLRTTVEEVERQLTAVARSYGGEFDGVEWAL